MARTLLLVPLMTIQFASTATVGILTTRCCGTWIRTAKMKGETMKALTGFLMALFSVWSAAFGQTDEAFCPYPSFCVEVGAGTTDLGGCFLARDRSGLIRLCDSVEEREQTGLPVEAEELIETLNVARAIRNRPPVTLENFASAQIAFLALSLDESFSGKKPIVAFKIDEVSSDTVRVELRLAAIPDPARNKSISSLPYASYRILAVEKPLLAQFGIANWAKASVMFDTPVEENIPCIEP